MKGSRKDWRKLMNIQKEGRSFGRTREEQRKPGSNGSDKWDLMIDALMNVNDRVEYKTKLYIPIEKLEKLMRKVGLND